MLIVFVCTGMTAQKVGQRDSVPKDLSEDDPPVLELMLRLFASIEDEAKRLIISDPDEAATFRNKFASEVGLSVKEFSVVAAAAIDLRSHIMEIDRKGSSEAAEALRQGRWPSKSLFATLEHSRSKMIRSTVNSISNRVSSDSYTRMNFWYWNVFSKTVSRRQMQ